MFTSPLSPSRAPENRTRPTSSVRKRDFKQTVSVLCGSVAFHPPTTGVVLCVSTGICLDLVKLVAQAARSASVRLWDDSHVRFQIIILVCSHNSSLQVCAWHVRGYYSTTASATYYSCCATHLYSRRKSVVIIFGRTATSTFAAGCIVSFAFGVRSQSHFVSHSYQLQLSDRYTL